MLERGEEMRILKPCVQSADNQKRDETQSALLEMWMLLCFSLSLSRARYSLCFACFADQRGIVM